MEGEVRDYWQVAQPSRALVLYKAGNNEPNNGSISAAFLPAFSVITTPHHTTPLLSFPSYKTMRVLPLGTPKLK